MSLDFISNELKKFKADSVQTHKKVAEFSHESPFLRTKREVQQELARAEKYRAQILKNVTTFGMNYSFISILFMWCLMLAGMMFLQLV
jgi:hypothetical protein